MPNHVRNIVRMKGIADLPLYGKGENGARYFDFNKLIPMPKELEVISGSEENVAIECALLRIKEVTDRSFLNPRIQIASRLPQGINDYLAATGMTFDQMAELGLKYIVNIVKYGATTWYDWCIYHWGTKWNAYDFESTNPDEIRFSTAWCEPGPIICKLHEMYPAAELEHVWADEDTGCNTGRRWFREDGDHDAINYENDSPEALDAYVECWGESECLYQDEKGQWHRKDCDDCHGCD